MFDVTIYIYHMLWHMLCHMSRI
ncbi:hypothetical protein ACN38_g2286, partial [Penicillium nordicum]